VCGEGERIPELLLEPKDFRGLRAEKFFAHLGERQSLGFPTARRNESEIDGVV
jgi:hypothetical protein